MIEAINASIASAPVVRPIAEEVTSSQSSNPVRVQKAAINAPYLSPHVRLSPDSKPVFVVRDAATGAQIQQFPTEAQIRAYQKAAESRVVVAPDGQEKVISSEQAKILIKSSVEFKEERAAVLSQQGSLPGVPNTASTDIPVQPIDQKA